MKLLIHYMEGYQSLKYEVDEILRGILGDRRKLISYISSFTGEAYGGKTIHPLWKGGLEKTLNSVSLALDEYTDECDRISLGEEKDGKIGRKFVVNPYLDGRLQDALEEVLYSVEEYAFAKNNVFAVRLIGTLSDIRNTLNSYEFVASLEDSVAFYRG